MKKYYNTFTPMRRSAYTSVLAHWIATVTSFPRNDVSKAHNRHCKLKGRGNPVQEDAGDRSKAFSLIELLISLIIISLVAAAFIPILTKKIKHQNSTLATGVINCKKFDERCMLCDKKECTLCSTQLNLIDGQYVDPKTSCTIKSCPDNCAKCNKGECLKCIDGFGLVDKTCTACPNNCTKCNGTTCTKCKDNYSLNDGKCIKGACLKVGNICVQRFNAGDPGGLEIPTNLVEIYSAQETTITAEHDKARCYVGKTAGDCNAKFGYSGCNRIVCSWYAAVKICAHYGLRLPTVSEAASFGINSIGKGEDGLQLCSSKDDPLSSKCDIGYRCIYGEYCNPHLIWCQRLDGKQKPINNGTVNPRNGGMYYTLNGQEYAISRYTDAPDNHGCNALAGSVRCVKDL